MEISVQSLKFDADQKLLDYVQKKVDKLSRFDEGIESVDVALSLMERPENKNVKVQAKVPGTTLIVERGAKTFEEAITDCVDAMKEKIVRAKEKRYGA